MQHNISFVALSHCLPSFVMTKEQKLDMLRSEVNLQYFPRKNNEYSEIYTRRGDSNPHDP